MLIRTKSVEELVLSQKENHPSRVVFLEASKIISNQFNIFFKTYSLAINKTYNRTGALFEKPFRRIEVRRDAYVTRLIWYIHFNPQKHGFIDNFKEYPHSSYHSHLLKNVTKLQREDVLNWFGGKYEYEKFHNMEYEDEKYLIEFD